MTEELRVPTSVEQGGDLLWCLHVLGPDDVHPAPDRATAQLWAAQWTVWNQRRAPHPHPFDPVDPLASGQSGWVEAFEAIVGEEAVYLTGSEKDSATEGIFPTVAQIKCARSALASIRSGDAG